MNTKKIIQEEVIRIQEIMGLSSSLLKEQPLNLVPKPLIKNMLKMSDDATDVILKFFNLTDNQIDNVVRQIDDVGVDNLSDDVLEVLSKSSKDNVDDLVRILKSNKSLGSNFDEIASRIFQRVDDIDVITMEQRDKVIKLYSDKLDRLSFLDGADEIKQKLVRDFKSEFDSRYSDIISRNVVEGISKEMDDLLRQTFESNVDDILAGTKSVDDVLSKFLSENGKKLSQYYNPRELADYVTQMKGALRQIEDRLAKEFGGDVSKVWYKMTLGQQREFAKKSVEEITKTIPFTYKDLFNVKKLTNYIIKGADNKFSINLFFRRIVNIWKMSIAIQLLGAIWKGTTIVAQADKGYELTWEDKLEVVMDGRSMPEFVFDMIVPFVSWAASLMASFDRDTTYDELKAQLPITKRDKIFRSQEGGYYFKDAGITYPLEIVDNEWQIQMNGDWYKLSEVEL